MFTQYVGIWGKFTQLKVETDAQFVVPRKCLPSM